MSGSTHARQWRRASQTGAASTHPGLEGIQRCCCHLAHSLSQADGRHKAFVYACTCLCSSSLTHTHAYTHTHPDHGTCVEKKYGVQKNDRRWWLATRVGALSAQKWATKSSIGQLGGTSRPRHKLEGKFHRLAGAAEGLQEALAARRARSARGRGSLGGSAAGRLKQSASRTK